MTSRIAEASVKKAVVTKLQQTAVKYLVRQVVRESEGSQISAHSGFVAIPDLTTRYHASDHELQLIYQPQYSAELLNGIWNFAG